MVIDDYTTKNMRLIDRQDARIGYCTASQHIWGSRDIISHVIIW